MNRLHALLFILFFLCHHATRAQEVADPQLIQQLTQLTNRIKDSFEAKKLDETARLQIQVAELLQSHNTDSIWAAMFYLNATSNIIGYAPDTALYCVQKGMAIIRLAIGQITKREEFDDIIKILNRHQWEVNRSFEDMGYDQVQSYALHYYIASALDALLTAYERADSLQMLADRDKAPGTDAWMKLMFRCVDHWTMIDEVKALSVASSHAAVIERLFGKKSLEYFVATDIVLHARPKGDKQKEIQQQYLKLGKRWKDDARYDSIVKARNSYLRFELMSIGIDISDVVITGSEHYLDIKAKALGETNDLSRPRPKRRKMTQEELVKESQKASSNADKFKRADRYQEALEWRKRAIDLYMRRSDIGERDTRNLFFYEFRQYLDLMKESGANEEELFHSVCDITDRMEAVNDTAALMFIQKIGYGWSRDWGNETDFCAYLKKKVEACDKKKQEPYWKALLWRVQASMLMSYPANYSLLRIFGNDSIAEAVRQRGVPYMEAAKLLIGKAVRHIEEKEGHNSHYFDMATSQMLITCLSVELQYVTYEEGRRQLEQYLQLLRKLPDYANHVEYLEVLTNFIQCCCSNASDWSYLQELAIPIILNYKDDDVYAGWDHYLYDHFYDKRLAINPDESASHVNCSRIWNSHEWLCDIVCESYMKQGAGAAVNMEVLGEYMVNELTGNIKRIANANFNMKSIDTTLDHCAHLMSICPDDSLSWLAYSTAMTCKGIRLYSSKLVERLALLSGNEEVMDIVERQREAVRKLNSLGTDATEQEETQLNEVIRGCESALYSKAKSLGYFHDMLFQSGDEVARHLKSDEAAIEFMSYKDQDGQNQLCAAVVNGENQQCHFLKLCRESDLPQNGETYLTDSIFRQIWKPILGICPQEVHNIYFSPIGKLNSIAIESVPIDHDGNLVSQQYRIYRLSNTREIVSQQRMNSSGLKAVLYGGINYYQQSETSQKPRFAYADNTQHDSNILRGALEYLSGTEEEVNNICPILNDASYAVTSYMGSEATEASFRQLGTSAPTLIHVATHGFADTTNSDDLEKGLSHTYLMMAGALNTNRQKREDTDTAANDGILTAREVAETDLGNVSLAVLSACQTALGIVSNEGVFGLQRGFKMAGVQSLLMTLWKVDDEATCLLMTEFYKHWIGEKMSKYDALEKAKQTVRSYKDKGWDNPEYWAAFILLDGLD